MDICSKKYLGFSKMDKKNVQKLKGPKYFAKNEKSVNL
jgi:hypothetical protein